MLFKNFLFNPAKLVNILLSPWRLFLLKMQCVRCGKSIQVIGKPYIDIRGGAIVLGDNVRLVSAQSNHEIGLPSAVVLTTRETGTIKIGDNSIINGATVRALKGVTIGKNVWLTSGCFIMDGAGHSLLAERRLHDPNDVGEVAEIIIEDDVWFGINTIVMPGVTIGKGAVIGAGSIVTHSIPPDVMAAGAPAKVISKISPKEKFVSI